MTTRATIASYRGRDDLLPTLMRHAAVLALLGSILSLFAISALTLETFGVGYVTSGGGVLSKFHPATFLAALALALRCLSSDRPAKTLLRLLTRDAGCLLLAGAVVVMAIVGTVVTKTPVTPLVDTFVLPILFFILLRDLDPVVLRWIALAIGLMLMLNACLALAEVLRGSHFITIPLPDGASGDPTRGDAVFDWRVEAAIDWRAQAMLGHPLVNGLVTGVFILCLAAPAAGWIPLTIRVPVAFFQVVAMFAFGARAALVFTLLFGAWLAASQMIEANAGRRLSARTVTIVVTALCAVAIGAFILGQTGFFDHTIARFSQDSGSATTRLTMFELFNEVSLQGLLFGPDKDVIATAQRVYGLEFGIESSWVGLVLVYGFIVTAVTVAGLFAFSLSVIRASGRGSVLALVLFFTLVSVAASLSGKITSFAITIVLIVAFLRSDLLGEPRRPVPRLGVV